MALGMVMLVALAGCRQDMHDAPRYDPLEASRLFADGQSARPPVEGTVARGQLGENPVFTTGLAAGGDLVRELPLTVDRALLERGRERFDIFCSPCHGRLGEGTGMIVRRGYKQPQSFHIERLRNAPVGYFFDVQTNGFGQMPSYAAQVPAADRWAIAAYIRVLQFSQAARLADLGEADRTELDRLGGGAGEGAETTPGEVAEDGH